jgi:hypothetical protein
MTKERGPDRDLSFFLASKWYVKNNTVLDKIMTANFSFSLVGRNLTNEGE